MMDRIANWLIDEVLPFLGTCLVYLFTGLMSLITAVFLFPLHVIRSLLSNYNLKLLSLIASFSAPTVTFGLFKQWIVTLKLDATLSWLHTTDAGAVVLYILISAAYWVMFYLLGRLFLVLEAAYEDSLDVVKMR